MSLLSILLRMLLVGTVAEALSLMPSPVRQSASGRPRPQSLKMMDLLLADVASGTAYGPQAPDSSVLAGLLGTVVLSAGAYVYWDKTIVPMKRLEISKSKRKGEIKEYLEEIRGDDDRKAEQWLLNDWLEPKEKDAAVPFLPKTKFNSGDNPVIAATAVVSSTFPAVLDRLALIF